MTWIEEKEITDTIERLEGRFSPLTRGILDDLPLGVPKPPVIRDWEDVPNYIIWQGKLADLLFGK